MTAYQHTNSKGVTYYLHGQQIELGSSGQKHLYYFSSKELLPEAVPVIPLGCTIMENLEDGLLTLVRYNEPLSWEYSLNDLMLPQTLLEIESFSPSVVILGKILKDNSSLERLHWREFEEIVADLLIKDGYTVTLGPGTKDEGIDIIAKKELEEIGWFMSVWQAKKLKLDNKVELATIRELADTRLQHKASKGMIVTNSYLTRGALERIRQDKYTLGKVDRDDLIHWILRVTGR